MICLRVPSDWQECVYFPNFRWGPKGLVRLKHSLQVAKLLNSRAKSGVFPVITWLGLLSLLKYVDYNKAMTLKMQATFPLRIYLLSLETEFIILIEQTPKKRKKRERERKELWDVFSPSQEKLKKKACKHFWVWTLYHRTTGTRFH